MSNRPLVIYHAGCRDGFTAAWCARRKLGDDCDFVPLHHGEPPPEAEGRDVYVLDFSFDAATTAALAARASRFVLLDHHRTAIEEMGRLDRDFWDLGPTVVLNVEKSGARLAWEYFFPGRPSPWLVDYVEDRDLWAWKLPASRTTNAAIRSRPMTFAQWDEFARWARAGKDHLALQDEGAAVLRMEEALVESIRRGAREVEIDGHRVLAANAPVLVSEVAGRLAEGRPFGAAWFLRSDGAVQWSLRSREGGVDVSAIARRRGGGGHRNAAGFAIAGSGFDPTRPGDPTADRPAARKVVEAFFSYGPPGQFESVTVAAFREAQACGGLLYSDLEAAALEVDARIPG